VSRYHKIGASAVLVTVFFAAPGCAYTPEWSLLGPVSTSGLYDATVGKTSQLVDTTIAGAAVVSDSRGRFTLHLRVFSGEGAMLHLASGEDGTFRPQPGALPKSSLPLALAKVSTRDCGPLAPGDWVYRVRDDGSLSNSVPFTNEDAVRAYVVLVTGAGSSGTVTGQALEVCLLTPEHEPSPSVGPWFTLPTGERPVIDRVGAWTGFLLGVPFSSALDVALLPLRIFAVWLFASGLVFI
jgi:hypothetical protein